MIVHHSIELTDYQKPRVRLARPAVMLIIASRDLQARKPSQLAGVSKRLLQATEYWQNLQTTNTADQVSYRLTEQ